MQRTDHRVGIRRKRGGWQAYITLGDRFYSRMFPHTATRREMQEWRRRQRAEIVATIDAVPERILPLTDRQKADVLAIVQEAICDQAVGKGSVLQGVRARLFVVPGPA
jgi:hypothetical protein